MIEALTLTCPGQALGGFLAGLAVWLLVYAVRRSNLFPRRPAEVDLTLPPGYIGNEVGREVKPRYDGERKGGRKGKP